VFEQCLVVAVGVTVWVEKNDVKLVLVVKN